MTADLAPEAVNNVCLNIADTSGIILQKPLIENPVSSNQGQHRTKPALSFFMVQLYANIFYFSTYFRCKKYPSNAPNTLAMTSSISNSLPPKYCNTSIVNTIGIVMITIFL